MKALHMVTYVLVIVGALNWGLMGLFNFNLVNMVLTSVGLSMLEKWVYVLVGVSAVYDFVQHMSYCRMCKPGK